jgi:signal transduction histidine kinase
MRKRIVTLAVVSATLATSLFAVPLAVAAARYFFIDQATRLERTADVAAVDVATDLVHARPPGDLGPHPQGTDVALYAADGRLVSGHGPKDADWLVRRSLADNNVHSDSDLGELTVAVPIADQPGAAYVVRAATSPRGVYPRIAVTWLGMIALEGIILTAIWQLARRQGRRLADPVETLAASAARLGDGDFTVRAGPSGIPEIDTAATALNRAAARIGNLVDRERAVTANASHQLRTPLAGLRLRLETALDTPDADYKTATREAIAAADRLERTIDDLVTLARTQEHRTQRLDILALLNELRDAWQGSLAEAGRALRVTADPQLRPSRASAAAVRQILGVLVDNAVRHGKGQVTVHARDASNTLAIDVTDSGRTIDHTKPFEQRAADGHGIGLPLARSLAEAEGGRLLLTSRAPTTFTLFLPAHEGE